MALSMLHQGRAAEADALLASEGYQVRLADSVFNYAAAGPVEMASCPVGVVYDRVLPPALVERLSWFLRDDAPFWTDHDYYSGKTGYFSYAHCLARPEKTLLEQVAAVLREALAADLPELRRARNIEWWAHNRVVLILTCAEHDKGHQLHWDTDAEGVAGVNNPIASVVIYLSHGVGGPTVMTEQRIGDPIATHGWMVCPPALESQVGRIAAFRGKYLHGVVQGHPKCKTREARRKTLMIAFWEDVKIRPSLFEAPGSCRPIPSSRPRWVSEIEKPVELLPSTGRDGRSAVTVPLLFVKPFFVSVTGCDLATMEMPHYDSVFQ